MNHSVAGTQPVGLDPVSVPHAVRTINSLTSSQAAQRRAANSAPLVCASDWRVLISSTSSPLHLNIVCFSVDGLGNEEYEGNWQI